MQALEWVLLGGEYVKSAVVIGCGAAHTAWQIAISEAQRAAIYADPKWNDGNVDME
jgi:homoserine O-acetyltransferase/O-succinyltransferase